MIHASGKSLMNFRGSASRKAPANRFDCRQRSQIKLHFFRSLLADKKNKVLESPQIRAIFQSSSGCGRSDIGSSKKLIF